MEAPKSPATSSAVDLLRQECQHLPLPLLPGISVVNAMQALVILKTRAFHNTEQKLLGSRSGLPPWQKMPGLPFLVDRFGKGTEKAACKSWFLTHFHSDHYKGLTSKFKAGALQYVHNAQLNLRILFNLLGSGKS